jgi:hypothetical protein
MPAYHNQDITKKREKDKKDIMSSLQHSGSALLDKDLHPKLVTMWTEGALLQRMPKGEQPQPPLGPCPLCKGNHWRSKSLISRWKAGCHFLWIDGSWGLLFRFYFLTSMLKSLG